MLFRLSAIGEACGWSLLIVAIAWQRYVTWSDNIPIQLAGHVHGVLFLAYALASVGLYPTLHWSRPRAMVALIASIPPYGSLLFERWAWHEHRRTEFKTYAYCVVLALCAEKPD